MPHPEKDHFPWFGPDADFKNDDEFVGKSYVPEKGSSVCLRFKKSNLARVEGKWLKAEPMVHYGDHKEDFKTGKYHIDYTPYLK